MKTLAVDCRMARMSGIGVYLRNTLPLCVSAMPDVRFRLLGYDGTFALPARREWEAVSFNAPVYGIAEQYKIFPLLNGCDALWVPHYPIPMLFGLPVIATVHDVAHLALRDLYTGIKRAYAKVMFQAVRRNAAEILFVSEFTRQEFLRHVGIPRGNVTVAHNGVDASWRQRPLQAREEPPYFLAVGNVKPHKNIRLLCRAFAKIADRCDANLLCIGESGGFRVGEPSLDELAHICPGRIRFTGFLPQEELAALTGRAVALVFPSRYEGFGLPPLEALSAGIPVIASDMPVTREVCGSFAAYFPPDSEDRIGELLLKTLAMPTDVRHRNGEQGRAWAKNFTWEKTARAIVPALRRALGE